MKALSCVRYFHSSAAITVTWLKEWVFLLLLLLPSCDCQNTLGDGGKKRMPSFGESNTIIAKTWNIVVFACSIYSHIAQKIFRALCSRVCCGMVWSMRSLCSATRLKHIAWKGDTQKCFRYCDHFVHLILLCVCCVVLNACIGIGLPTLYRNVCVCRIAIHTEAQTL